MTVSMREDSSSTMTTPLLHNNEIKIDKHEEATTQPGSTKFDTFTASFTPSSYNPSKSMSTAKTVGSSLMPDSISKVERSWYLISDKNRVGVVGQTFFLKMFDEYPELVALFPFGEDSIDHETGKLKLNDRTKKHVRAHASAVMRTVGTCVAGLTSIEDLIPRLRSVGATHKTVGVQNMHYDILYRHLVEAIREEVGPDNWDQETEDAWEQAYLSVTDLIKKPSKLLETEPLRGWGVIMLVACVYFTLVTPFRFAGFYIGHFRVILALDVLDLVCALIMFLDLVIYAIQSKQRVDDVDDDSSVDSFLSKTLPWLHRQQFSVAQSMIHTVTSKQRGLMKRLQKWKMDRSIPWPSLDGRVLLSFALQGLFYRSSLCRTPGLHFTQLAGLLRVSCVFRVLHFLQCAENNALLDQKLDHERQLILRITKLLVRLAFITHVSACMWCAVARVGLGPEATVFSPTPFFPNPEVLFGEDRNVFNSYSRAIHWAFVNLSGIGGVDSVPNTSLECWFTLTVHMIGAVFYAIVTGNVITILETSTDTENRIGNDIARLSKYLTTARVSELSKERIMKGYMMRNVLTEGGGTSAPNLDELLDSKDDILGTLPNYLRLEVGLYARAELIRRRDKFFAHCSRGFLVSLSTSLSRTRTLLTGDYLIKKGELVVPEFGVIESGTLQVERDGHNIMTLERGHCIGKNWLIQITHDALGADEFSEDTDWLKRDGTAGLSIRVMSPCVLITGLSTVGEIERLERGYRVDFKLLRAEAKGRNIDDSERKAMAMRGIGKAVRRFRMRREKSRARDNGDKLLAGVQDEPKSNLLGESESADQHRT